MHEGISQLVHFSNTCAEETGCSACSVITRAGALGVGSATNQQEGRDSVGSYKSCTRDRFAASVQQVAFRAGSCKHFFYHQQLSFDVHGLSTCSCSSVQIGGQIFRGVWQAELRKGLHNSCHPASHCAAARTSKQDLFQVFNCVQSPLLQAQSVPVRSLHTPGGKPGGAQTATCCRRRVTTAVRKINQSNAAATLRYQSLLSIQSRRLR